MWAVVMEDTPMDELQESQSKKKVFEALFGPRGSEKSPLDHFTTNLYREIWTRTALTVSDRSMITVALLAALGRDRELARHIEGALNIGISCERINEIMLHVAHYAGWPAGHNGQCIALELYREEATPKQYDTLRKNAREVPENLTRGRAGDLIAKLTS